MNSADSGEKQQNALLEQVAQWATIANLGASIMFGNTIIYDAQWQVTLLETVTKFKLIQAFNVILVTCKNEEDSSKNKGTRVVTTFLPLQVYGNFS